MQVKYNNQWHEVRAILADGVVQELTPDKIDDVRLTERFYSHNRLADEHAEMNIALGEMSVALRRLDEKYNQLDKRYESDDATESK
jgi:hypothetical protein